AGDHSGAIGDPSTINAAASYSVGNSTTLNGSASPGTSAQDLFSMGNDNTFGTASTFITNAGALGSHNVIESNDVFVLGSNITVGSGYDGNVVLGNASVTDHNHGSNAATDYTIDGTTPAGLYGTTNAPQTVSV